MSHHLTTFALAMAAIASACGGSTTRPSEPIQSQSQPSRPDVAAVGVNNPQLRELLEDHWQWVMEQNPVWATTLGDHRFDDRIADESEAAIAAQRAKRRELLGRAGAIDSATLEPADRITRDLLIGELEADIAIESCESHLWSISARSNPVTEFNVLPQMHKVATAEDAANLLARYKQIASAVDVQRQHLQTGLKRKLVANAETVRRTIELIDKQLAQPVEQWALVKPSAASYPDWTGPGKDAWATELRSVVENDIAAALRRYVTTLREEVLPAARAADKVGVGHLPGGAACYAARVRYYTGLDLDPRQVHETGLAEIERINREMVELDGKGRKLAAIIDQLHNDKALYYNSAEEMVREAEVALAAAKAAIPKYFGRLPEADCVVVPIPDYEAPYTTIAYYREPHADGRKPGEYFINTYQPETRPRFEMQVLTYHESIPGHHLQIAISQELDDLPAFRRYLGSTAFVEGWALYTERLADEMGLYSSDLDRMGMLSYDAWRAARLVVDTGIHVMGWTREQAEAYMQKHTALTRVNIVNEVDRYISWPGQALAYKVGQMEIWRLRRAAEIRLQEKFSLSEFHDVVLGSGAVTLPVMTKNLEEWMKGISE